MASKLPQTNCQKPCAACRYLRKKCQGQDCIMAPCFPSDCPAEAFAAVHKVYGASNFIRFIKAVPKDLREDAARSWIYEANVKVKDPVYGCAGIIYRLCQQISELKSQLALLHARILLLQSNALPTTMNLSEECIVSGDFSPCAVEDWLASIDADI